MAVFLEQEASSPTKAHCHVLSTRTGEKAKLGAVSRKFSSAQHACCGRLSPVTEQDR